MMLQCAAVLVIVNGYSRLDNTAVDKAPTVWYLAVRDGGSGGGGGGGGGASCRQGCVGPNG